MAEAESLEPPVTFAAATLLNRRRSHSVDPRARGDKEEEEEGEEGVPLAAAAATSTTTDVAEDAAQRLRARLNSAGYIQKFRLPPAETLLFDCSAALSKSILIQGRLYLSTGYLCFYAKIFGQETKEAIRLRDVASVARRARFVIGAEVVTDAGTRYLFTSFLSPTKTIDAIIAAWEKARNPAALSLPSSPTLTHRRHMSLENTPQPISAVASPALPPPQITLNRPDGSEKQLQQQQSASEGVVEIEGEDLFLVDESVAVEAGFLDAPEMLEEIVSGELPVTPMQAFALFFADGARAFDEEHFRRTDRSGAKVGKWMTHEQFGRVRDLRFVVAIKGAPIGPPSSRVEETQRLYLSRSHLVVESVSSSLDVPFADYFRALARFDLSAVPDSKSTHVCISGGLSFTKRTILKSAIVSASKKQMREAFSVWLLLAREWAETHPLPGMLSAPSSPVSHHATLASASASASVSELVSPPLEAKATTTMITATATATATTSRAKPASSVARARRFALETRDLVWLLLLACAVLACFHRIAKLEARIAKLEA